MIQNALEENDMVKATVYKCVKREKDNWECWQNKEMSEQEEPSKTQQTVHKIESFSTKFARLFIWWLLMSLTSAMVLQQARF